MPHNKCALLYNLLLTVRETGKYFLFNNISGEFLNEKMNAFILGHVKKFVSVIKQRIKNISDLYFFKKEGKIYIFRFFSY